MIGRLTLSQPSFSRISELMYARSGVALRPQKNAMVVSRLTPVLRELNMDSFEGYLGYLDNHWEDKDIVDRFVNAITTNRTEFFRDKNQYRALAKELRSLRDSDHNASKLIRIWSAACSTGEEAYSIAMVGREIFSADEFGRLRILASDIDTEVLTNASAGIFKSHQLNPIPRRWLKSGFGSPDPNDPLRRTIHPDLRKMIVFRRINLVTDEFRFRKPVDIVFLCNVMIYFDIKTQDLILEKIRRILRPDGLLFVGHAESSAVSRHGFLHLGNNAFRRTGDLERIEV
ncbi:MAG: hypothetical protein K8R59_06110 [Thermoanaerobaculales bacterium]|nr:hypothetical protein [Thermoanaerobaculales bacterium]